MKIQIPRLDQVIKLTKPWPVKLKDESRNATMKSAAGSQFTLKKGPVVPD